MSRDLKNQIASKLDDPRFDRLEKVARKFGLEKSEIIRRSLDIALPKFERSNRLPAVVPEEGSSE